MLSEKQKSDFKMSGLNSLDSLLAEAEKGASEVGTRANLEKLKASFLGSNGSLTQILKGINQLPKAERPAFGKQVNEIKRHLEGLFSRVSENISEMELKSTLGREIDPTLPSPECESGALHLLTQVRENICSIFRQAGFSVAEGSEVETEFFCFDALNTLPDHPARDLQDTFYLPESLSLGNVLRRGGERYLLRTHTSAVQIRTMLERNPPLRILSPGRVFRRDTADATHSPNFHQVEGLYVDRNVSVKDLKAVLDFFSRSLLGPEAKTRFRPHFFPNTEPSFEVDFQSSHLAKVGTEWTEILGCGMVDPAVFEAVGYDSQEWTGYAFGIGIDRVAQILHGVDDMRILFQNDVRFLRQFR